MLLRPGVLFRLGQSTITMNPRPIYLGIQLRVFGVEIFFHSEDEQVFKDVAACISLIYKRLEYGNEQFPGFFSLHSFGFVKDEKRMERRKCCKHGDTF